MASCYPFEDEHFFEYIGKNVSIGRKFGTIQYVGKIPGSDNFYFGIELEEAVGNNDGMVNSIRCFSCKENCGIFIPVEYVVYNEHFERFILSLDGNASDLFLGDKGFFQEDSLNAKIDGNVFTATPSLTPPSIIQSDFLLNSVQESENERNRKYVVSEEQGTELSILEEMIEFHDDFEDKYFDNELLFSKCEGNKVDEQLCIKERENVVENLKGNYGCDAGLETFSNELYKSPWDSSIFDTGGTHLNTTVILSEKNELNKTVTLATEADKNKSLNPSMCIFQDLEVTDSSSESLGILPHLLDDDDESPWDSLIYPDTSNLNAVVILSKKNELNQSVAVATDVHTNESPVSHAKNSLKYTSTPRIENKFANVMNEDLQFEFGVNETSPKGVKNKSFELILNEKNAKNLSPIASSTSRILNLTCNILEYELVKDSSKDLNLAAHDFPSQENEISQGQNNLNQLCDAQRVLNSTFAKDSNLKENFENKTGSLMNILNTTYTEDLITETEALALNEPKELSSKSAEHIKNEQLNLTYGKIDESLKLDTYSKTSRYSLKDECKQTENVKISQGNFKSKLKRQSLPPIHHPVPFKNKFENNKPSLKIKPGVKKSFGNVSESRVISERKDETAFLKHTGKSVSDKYDVKENIKSIIFSENKDFLEGNLNFSDNVLNINSSQPKNETLIIQSSEKSISDKCNIKGSISQNLLDNQSLQAKDSNEGGSFTKSKMQSCQDSLLNKTINLSLLASDTKGSLAKPEIPLKGKTSLKTRKQFLDQSGKGSPLKVTAPLQSSVIQTSAKRFSYSSGQKINLPDVMKVKEKHLTKIPEERQSLQPPSSRIPSFRINTAPKTAKKRHENKLNETVIVQNHNARKSESVKPAACSQIPLRTRMPGFFRENRKQVTGELSGPKETDSKVGKFSKRP